MKHRSRAGLYYLIVIGLSLAVIGGIFTWLLGRSYLEARATRNWDESTAIILESGVATRKLGPAVPTDYRHKILFGYDWGGESFTGERVSRRENPWSKAEERARAEADRYAVGTAHPVFVNPDEPEEAVLEHDSQAAGYSIWFPILFVVGGLGIVVAAVRKM